MAIPTKYDGIEYRSRLEARWAAFMMNIGWDIVYEPFDGDGYIPDFLVQGNRPMLIEVKPAATQAEYAAPVAKIEQGLARHWQHDILIVGASPFPQPMGNYTIWGRRDGKDITRVAGWMGQHMAEHFPEAENDPWSWDSGEWITCGECGFIAVYHTVQSFGGRPCWCVPGGDHHLGYVRPGLLESFWADACNDVKWRGKAA